jgi:hypothetical protein
MLSGAETAIIAQLILCLSWTSISSANILTDIPKNNPLNIDWDPAPSPEDGPPLSAGASRNRALLPAQISGIVGAYLFSVFVVGVVLLLVARKLRRQLQHSTKNLDIEMVEPHSKAYHTGPSPVSPGKIPGSPRNFSWPSPDTKEPNPYVFPTTVRDLGVVKQPRSPPGYGDPFVDNRVVAADRDMLQRDLEDIYAHVMQQEEAKAAGVNVKEMPLPPQLQAAGPAPTTVALRQPIPPKKIEKTRPKNINVEQSQSPTKSHSRSSSIISSLKSPKRRGIRGMRISDPIPTPLHTTFPSSATSDEEPLSPRFYAPPPPPPVPKDQTPYTHSRNNSQGPSPVNPYARHQPNASQASVQSSSLGDPVSAASATSQTPLFPDSSAFKTNNPFKNNNRPKAVAITPPSYSNPPSTNSSSRALPLRQFEPALHSPSFSHSTKTTVLERTTPPNSGLHTGGLKTPWSAGAVPYSPYQPFTPMVPITPTLVTKEQRRKMKKMEPRTPVEEMVKSEDDLWDSGY